MNVLVYAFNDTGSAHPQYRDWLRTALTSNEPVAISELVLSSVVRVTTNPRVFSPPASLAAVLGFAETLRSEPNVVTVSPGERHWNIFERLCVEAGVRGNLMTDAYLAALAIESGCELITTDRDFARFPGLRWRHPLACPRLPEVSRARFSVIPLWAARPGYTGGRSYTDAARLY